MEAYINEPHCEADTGRKCGLRIIIWKQNRQDLFHEVKNSYAFNDSLKLKESKGLQINNNKKCTKLMDPLFQIESDSFEFPSKLLVMALFITTQQPCHFSFPSCTHLATRCFDLWLYLLCLSGIGKWELITEKHPSDLEDRFSCHQLIPEAQHPPFEQKVK